MKKCILEIDFFKGDFFFNKVWFNGMECVMLDIFFISGVLSLVLLLFVSIFVSILVLMLVLVFWFGVFELF